MKSSSKHTDPRGLALDVLDALRRDERYVDEVLDENLRRGALSQPDARLARHLVYSVVKLRPTLDHIAAAFSRTPLDRIDPPVLDALRLGLVQLVYSDGIPDHAALNETVGALSRAVRKQLVGFANGILRSVARSIVRTDLAGPRHTFDPRRIPRSRSRHVLFDRAVLPEAASPTAALAAQFGYPEFLVGKLAESIDYERVVELLELGNRPATLFLRPNPARTDPTRLAARLEQLDIRAQALDNGLVRANNLHDAALSEVLGRGDASVQDSAAWSVVRAVCRLEPTSVLDLCAAPGGKATGIAEQLGDRARVLAADVNEARLARVRENIDRLGLTSVETVCCDGRTADRVLEERFDLVLVDAPCSNTGVLRRRPEARHRVDRTQLAALAALQDELLAAAGRLVRPGGHLCYSTCSVIADENEHAIMRFLAGHGTARVVERQLFLPDESGADGGFYSIIEMEGSAETYID